ncbi:MAG TPA: alkaline phosphatase family protein [bacterium]|nr:alkaline phosphatase family protein [bacterium]
MSQPDTLNLFVFIDAFGWEICKRNSFLEEVLPHRQPLATLLGYSSTCDPTIITGCLPRDHGHFSFFFYNHGESPFGWCRYLEGLPRFITRRGRVRHWLSRLIQRAHGYTGYFQIYNVPFRLLPYFDYSEKRDIYQEGGINNGNPTIFTFLRDQKIPFYLSDWRRPEEHNLSALEQDILRGEIRFAYLYLAAMDAILHQWGTRDARVREKIEGYDRSLRRILDLARRQYAHVNLTVFSDHGMTDIREQCDLIPRIESTNLRFGTDYVAMYDSTMARFWFLKPEARPPIEAVLRSETQGRILTEDELAEFGCDFPGHGYGDLIFLLNPGVLLCPSFMGETPLRGMHGYDPRDTDSIALFATNMNGFEYPKRLDDLYRIMRQSIQAEP